jgi:hypothetical protein
MRPRWRDRPGAPCPQVAAGRSDRRRQGSQTRTGVSTPLPTQPRRRGNPEPRQVLPQAGVSAGENGGGRWKPRANRGPLLRDRSTPSRERDPRRIGTAPLSRRPRQDPIGRIGPRQAGRDTLREAAARAEVLARHQADGVKVGRARIELAEAGPQRAHCLRWEGAIQGLRRIGYRESLDPGSLGLLDELSLRWRHRGLQALHLPVGHA